MKVFITGGTGFVGKTLVRTLLDQGHQVTVLSRSAPRGQPASRGLVYEQGDPTVSGSWQEKVAKHDAAINLAGVSIFRRWTQTNKKAIRESRILTTETLVEALSARKGRQTVLISASGTGYYGHRNEEGLGEGTPSGTDFLALLSRDWEAAAREAEHSGIRVVVCRLGVVLGRDGGALKTMAAPFRWGMGSPLGKGGQWFSWIHEMDLVSIFAFLLHRTDVSGPVNCTAPYPIRNQEMTKILGKVLKRPTFLPPVPGFILKKALGEFADVFLHGQCAVPTRLLDLGFSFQFPSLEPALENLLKD